MPDESSAKDVPKPRSKAPVVCEPDGIGLGIGVSIERRGVEGPDAAENCWAMRSKNDPN